MTRLWDFRPENVDPSPPKGPDGPDISTPNFWYDEAWYRGVTFGLGGLAVAVGVLFLAGRVRSEWLLWIAGAIALAAFVPLFGGLAGLGRRLIGERALKVLVVGTVLALIVVCGTFLLWAGGAFK